MIPHSDIHAALDLLRDSPTRVMFGPGKISTLGAFVSEIGAKRVLLVTDPGLVLVGHVERALDALRSAGADVAVFDGARENPTTAHVEAGVAVAQSAGAELIVGLGGGSAMDCAKGINLIVTNGGSIADYWGINKAVKPMLPLIAIPTTAGTGSEAQSFALISDAATHRKMACGDRRLPTDGGLRPRVAILDPDLMESAPRQVAAAAGIDAIVHAVESAATTTASPVSQSLSKTAWELLAPSFPMLMSGDADAATRDRMLLGAHLAGAAIEQSMLGAVHASANPLTARFGIRHGQAVGVMLPHVVRFNCQDGANPYRLLGMEEEPFVLLIWALVRVGEFPTRLRDYGVLRNSFSELASLAVLEWTGKFNPRPVGEAEFVELYEAAY